jgi:hypothetical protein
MLGRRALEEIAKRFLLYGVNQALKEIAEVLSSFPDSRQITECFTVHDPALPAK